MVCKGICHRYKANWGRHQYRYASGQKRYNVCEIYVNWNGHCCPCCGMVLRTRPRNGEYKRKMFAQEIKIKKISNK